MVVYLRPVHRPGVLPVSVLARHGNVSMPRLSVFQLDERADLVSFVQNAKSIRINAYAAGFEIDVTCTGGTEYALGVTDNNINFFRNGRLMWSK